MLFTSRLENCCICPRMCRTDRKKSQGFCRTGILPMVSSVCVHHGEEPVISGEKGICNVFFSHCNLKCIYCQNYQISRNENKDAGIEYTIEELSRRIIAILDTGIDMLGFVSPTHFSLQMVEIIETLNKNGYYPTIVYNSNGYDDAGMLSQITSYIDVYLPDIKYSDNDLANAFSGVTDYKEVSTAAIREMYRQKGAKLKRDRKGLVRNGIIIRHLALPGHVENTKNALKFIADLNPEIHISLMAQYYPPFLMEYEELNRNLYKSEYETVLDYLDKFGMENGWIQEMESSTYYRPDFNKENPFEIGEE